MSDLTVCDVWQVGIALHYSSLSTLLWIGVSSRVIYKEAVWRMPRQPEGESPVPPTQRPMLRSVVTSERDATSPTSNQRLAIRCQYSSCFREMRELLCTTTQNVPNQRLSLCRQAKPLCFEGTLEGNKRRVVL